MDVKDLQVFIGCFEKVIKICKIDAQNATLNRVYFAQNLWIRNEKCKEEKYIFRILQSFIRSHLTTLL